MEKKVHCIYCGKLIASQPVKYSRKYPKDKIVSASDYLMLAHWEECEYCDDNGPRYTTNGERI